MHPCWVHAQDVVRQHTHTHTSKREGFSEGFLRRVLAEGSAAKRGFSEGVVRRGVPEGV